VVVVAIHRPETRIKHTTRHVSVVFIVKSQRRSRARAESA
jgi:hypothetical protein